MFEQTMVDGVKRTNPWNFAVSVTVQSALVAGALALPLLQVAKLDPPMKGVVFLPRPLGRPEPVKQTTAKSSTSATTLVSQLTRTYRPFQWPSKIPDHVATGPDLPDAPRFAIEAGGVGVPEGIDLPGVAGLEQKQLMPLPPPEPAKHAPQPAAQQTSLHVSEGVQAAKLVFGPKPAYPPLARAARISGSVRLAATIAPDGRIRDLRVLGGHPMLVNAAIEAVRQWVYQPTLLNRQPVEVFTDITVNFVMNQ